ncbi:hypothetical protein XFF6990_60030 [Xanthomonas citri pv. fuscans]|uniref:Uncharacterized protein n=1 Tax=Xanthomonas campestris pv. phaseoli TaxID=317013 RepID=A0A7Z7NI97_XANCH|nr:hypothetical protein XFF6990_60030 [Xanthomonas citri pv. fuscans]SOO25023.1 hypothetical protein XFF6991_420240 [Xanthomonas phaseoli pv. phaseoli]
MGQACNAHAFRPPQRARNRLTAARHVWQPLGPARHALFQRVMTSSSRNPWAFARHPLNYGFPGGFKPHDPPDFRYRRRSVLARQGHCRRFACVHS